MSSKRRILIVEDETNLVALLEIRLGANGYEVLKAHDGEAEEKTSNSQPRVLEQTVVWVSHLKRGTFSTRFDR